MSRLRFLSLISFIYKATGSPIFHDFDKSIVNPDDLYSKDPYDDDADGIMVFFIILFSFFGITFLFSILSLVIYTIRKRFATSEDDLIRQEENQVYLELNSEEQELYFQSKDYLNLNPYFRNDLTLSQNLSIQEKGINAWEFTKDAMLTNNDLLILNKYELNFFKRFECSTQTNLPIPNKNEVYYFESKIYNLPDPENTMISIGIGVKPYPWFRLPGRHAHSVSYDSDGLRRHNQPFKSNIEPPFPGFLEGDVIGIGYRVRTGTIFFTRNGKKLSESKIGGHIKNFKIPENGQIYPIIGANNLCSVHVNLGQMGFVFIEGNVKKWGFAPLEGSGPAPPAYNKFNSDILLERSEVDENDLSEREEDFPPDFWQMRPNDDVNSSDKFSYNAYGDDSSNDERISLNSLMPPYEPPSYHGEPVEEPQEYEELDSDIDADETYFSEFATANEVGHSEQTNEDEINGGQQINENLLETGENHDNTNENLLEIGQNSENLSENLLENGVGGNIENNPSENEPGEYFQIANDTNEHNESETNGKDVRNNTPTN